MLPRKRRLSRPDIVSVVKNGRTARVDGLTLKFLAKAVSQTTQFSFILTGQSKVGAARRNKLKRRARHIVRKLLSKLQTGFWCVFLLDRTWQNRDFLELENKIVFLLRRARILA